MRLVAFALLGGAAALLPALFMWGFTVDDALISVRYAAHFASGAGWRFDVGGPVTDGVTPLPWVPMLAPFARGDALSALVRAKAIGVIAWTGAGAALGVTLAERARSWSAAVALGVIALAFPIGAWASSGMETGLATALATLAAIGSTRPRQSALLGGGAAALRPELLPWAMVVAASAKAGNRRARFGHVGLAAAPFAACVAARLAVFGHPAPLAVQAKPSDLEHGIVYALAAALAVLTPILALSPRVVLHGSREARAVLGAFLVHVVVVVAVGGDWMPYARLMVPVAPSLALVFVDASVTARPVFPAIRAGIALLFGAVLLVRAAPAGRHVQRDREALVAAARPVLAEAKVIAALDIGWVSAAAPDDVRIVDLAGLTDPSIAVLPGGHTSKRVDPAMLLERGVDTVVVFGAPRVVEARLLRADLFTARFRFAATLPLGDRGATYEVWSIRRGR